MSLAFILVNAASRSSSFRLWAIELSQERTTSNVSETVSLSLRKLATPKVMVAPSLLASCRAQSIDTVLKSVA